MADTVETNTFELAARRFGELLELMAKLRAPGGCPWDRKQTFASIKPYTLEETYEVLDAIDAEDWPGLCEELGDFILQAVFYAEMAAESDRFTMADVLAAINAKLIRRHPHVFGNAMAETPEDVKLRWDEIKNQEKTREHASILDSIPRSLPALMEADKLGRKASAVGFDWPDTAGVLDKMTEEAQELAAAQANGDRGQMEHELGDLLFNVVNLARQLKVDPEQALRKTNARFRQRFAHIEQGIAAFGGTLESTSLEDMEQLWRSAKRLERSRA